MPPKVKPAAKAAAKKKKTEDEEDALLEQQIKLAESGAKKLAKEKAKSDADKARKAKEAAKEEAAALEAHYAAVAKMGPLFVDDVARKVWELHGGETATFRDMCWLAYTFHNFLSFAVENKRQLRIRTAKAPEEGEEVTAYAVHDLSADVNSPHSWNVVTCASGVHAVDITLKQFATTGRHGYKRAEDVAGEPYALVPFPSRLKKEGSSEVHTGVVASDAGIIAPSGSVTVKDSVPRGNHVKYVTFLKNAASARYKGMSPAERKAAEIIHRQLNVDKLFSVHDELAAAFFPEASKAV